MDITTLIGIAVAFGLVIISILMGGDGTWFINYPSIMIVMGGTMGATLLSFPLSEVLGVFKVAKNVFLHRSQIAGDFIPLMSGFAKKARQEGILSFEYQLKDIKDPFMAPGSQMGHDGLIATAKRHRQEIEDHFGSSTLLYVMDLTQPGELNDFVKWMNIPVVNFPWIK